FPNHAQLQPALAGSLAAPQPFKDREVTVDDDELNNYQQSDYPLWRVGQTRAYIRGVRDDQKDNRHRDQYYDLNRVIDCTGDEAVANRRQHKVQRHALRRFDYECVI